MFRNGNMDVQNIMDIDSSRVCRLCLVEEENMIYIFDPKGYQGFRLWEIIKELLQVEVSTEDGLPGTVCSGCIDKVREFKQFKTICIKAKITFLTMIASRGIVSNLVVRAPSLPKPGAVSSFSEKSASDTSDKDSGDEVEVVEIVEDELQMVTTDKFHSPVLSTRQNRASYVPRKSSSRERQVKKIRALSDETKMIACDATETSEALCSDDLDARDSLSDEETSVGDDKNQKSEKPSTEGCRRVQGSTIKGAGGGEELVERKMAEIETNENKGGVPKEGPRSKPEKRGKRGRKPKRGKTTARKRTTQIGAAVNFIAIPVAETTEDRGAEECGTVVDPLSLVKEESVAVDNDPFGIIERQSDENETIGGLPSRFPNVGELNNDVKHPLKVNSGVVDSQEEDDGDSSYEEPVEVQPDAVSEVDQAHEVKMEFEETKYDLEYPVEQTAEGEDQHVDSDNESQSGTSRGVGNITDTQEGEVRVSPSRRPETGVNFISMSIVNDGEGVNGEDLDPQEEDPLALLLDNDEEPEIDTIMLDEDEDSAQDVYPVEEGCATTPTHDGDSATLDTIEDVIPQTELQQCKEAPSCTVEGTEKQCSLTPVGSTAHADSSLASEPNLPSESHKESTGDGSHLVRAVDAGGGQTSTGITPVSSVVRQKQVPATSASSVDHEDVLTGTNATHAADSDMLQDLIEVVARNSLAGLLKSCKSQVDGQASHSLRIEDLLKEQSGINLKKNISNSVRVPERDFLNPPNVSSQQVVCNGQAVSQPVRNNTATNRRSGENHSPAGNEETTDLSCPSGQSEDSRLTPISIEVVNSPIASVDSPCSADEDIMVVGDKIVNTLSREKISKVLDTKKVPVVRLQRLEEGHIPAGNQGGPQSENSGATLAETSLPGEAKNKKATTRQSRGQKKAIAANKRKRKRKQSSTSDTSSESFYSSENSDGEWTLRQRSPRKTRTCLSSGNRTKFEEQVHEINLRLKKRRDEHRDKMKKSSATLLPTLLPNDVERMTKKIVSFIEAKGGRNMDTSLCGAVECWWETVSKNKGKMGKEAVAELSSLLTYTMYFRKLGVFSVQQEDPGPSNTDAPHEMSLQNLKERSSKMIPQMVTQVDAELSQGMAPRTLLAQTTSPHGSVTTDSAYGASTDSQEAVLRVGVTPFEASAVDGSQKRVESLPAQSLSTPEVPAAREGNLSSKPNIGENQTYTMHPDDRKELWGKANDLFQLLMKIPHFTFENAAYECHICRAIFSDRKEIYLHVIKYHFGEESFPIPGSLDGGSVTGSGMEPVVYISVQSLGAEMTVLTEKLIQSKTQVEVIDVPEDNGLKGLRTFPMYRPIAFNSTGDGFGKGMLMKCGWCQHAYYDLKSMSKHMDRDHANIMRKLSKEARAELEKKVQKELQQRNMQQSDAVEPSIQQSSVDQWNMQQLSVQSNSVNQLSIPQPSVQQSSVMHSSVQKSSKQRAIMPTSSIQQLSLQDPSMQYSSIPHSSVPQLIIQQSNDQNQSMQHSSIQQSSVQHPSMQYSTMQHSGMPQLEIQQSTMLQPSILQLSVQEPSKNYSIIQNSSLHWSNKQQPSLLQPNTPQSNDFHLWMQKLAKLQQLHPSQQQPSTSQAGIPPSSMRYSFVQNPGMQQSTVQQLRIQQPGIQQSTIPQSSIQQPGIQQSTIPQSRIQQPGIQQSTIPQSSIQQPGIQQSTIPQSSIQQPGIQQSTIPQSSIQQPGIQQSTIPQSSIQQPGIQHYSIPQSSIQQAGVEQSRMPQLSQLMQSLQGPSHVENSRAHTIAAGAEPSKSIIEPRPGYYRCKYCPETFSYKNDLRKHRHIFHGSFPRTKESTSERESQETIQRDTVIRNVRPATTYFVSPRNVFVRDIGMDIGSLSREQGRDGSCADESRTMGVGEHVSTKGCDGVIGNLVSQKDTTEQSAKRPPETNAEGIAEDITECAVENSVGETGVGSQRTGENNSGSVGIAGEVNSRLFPPRIVDSENDVAMKESAVNNLEEQSSDCTPMTNPISGTTENVALTPLSSSTSPLTSDSVVGTMRPVQCTACPEVFQTVTEIWSHHTKVHMQESKDPVQEVASIQCSSQDKPKATKCSMCDMTFPSAADSKNHFAKIHVPELYERQRQLQINKLYKGSDGTGR